MKTNHWNVASANDRNSMRLIMAIRDLVCIDPIIEVLFIETFGPLTNGFSGVGFSEPSVIGYLSFDNLVGALVFILSKSAVESWPVGLLRETFHEFGELNKSFYSLF